MGRRNISFSDMEDFEHYADEEYKFFAEMGEDFSDYEANYTDANLHKTFGAMSIAKSAADIRKVMSTMKNKATTPTRNKELVPLISLQRLSQMKPGLSV